MRETRGFVIRFGLLAGCLALAAVNTGNNLLYLVLSLMIALVATAWALASRSLRRVEVRLRAPEEVVAGRPFLVGVEVTARPGRLPSPWARASLRGLEGDLPELDLPALPPGERSVACATARAARRGIHRDMRLELTTSYPFGLLARRRSIPQAEPLVVTPRRFAIRSLKLPDPDSRGSERVSRPGEGTDLFNLRDYTPVDDARRIDWKATARVNRPMLREFEREREIHLDLVLDERPSREASPAAFERMVETAASILDHCRESGIRARLIVAGDGREASSLEGRGAMSYLAQAQPRSGLQPHLYGPPRGGAPRVVLSMNHEMATPMEIDWKEARPWP